jgi:hypothetical protein
MTLMHRHDPAAQEAGFQALRSHARDYVPALIEAFRTETDHGLRCWLLELIGEGRSPEAFDLFAEQLDSDDGSFRDWAERGLRKLDTRASRQLLRERERL